MTPAPDPVDLALARERAVDHARAQQRGARVLDVTDAVLALLVAAGLFHPAHVDAARPLVFHELADDLYGNLAVDIPPMRDGMSRPVVLE